MSSNNWSNSKKNAKENANKSRENGNFANRAQRFAHNEQSESEQTENQYERNSQKKKIPDINMSLTYFDRRREPIQFKVDSHSKKGIFNRQFRGKN